DRSRTAFVLVTLAERLAIEETARAAAQLEQSGLDVAALVVNRLLPDGLTGDFYAARKEQESAYRREIAERFAGMPPLAVTQLERDVFGVDLLGRVTGELLPLL